LPLCSNGSVPSASRRKRAAAARRAATHPLTDPHAAIVVKTLKGLSSAISDLRSKADPVAAADEQIDRLIATLSSALAGHDAVRLIEIARLRCLPWNFQPVEAQEHGPAQAELIALIALTASCQELTDNFAARRDPENRRSGDRSNSPQPGVDGEGSDTVQPLTNLVYGSIKSIDELLLYAEARAFLAAERLDPMDAIAARMRSNEIWMRTTSYPDRVRRTLEELFADREISEFIRSTLGFDALSAVAILQTCHDIQVCKMNNRMIRFRTEMADMMVSSSGRAGLSTGERELAERVWNSFWDPSAEEATVAYNDLAAVTGLPEPMVRAVADFFGLNVENWTPQKAVSVFTSGSNPLRVSPVVLLPGRDRMMLVHDAYILSAVREALEQHLKSSPKWDRYQSLRGDLLEARTKTAFERVLPGADAYHSFHYFVPSSDEESNGTPTGYTKKVEGDHLFVMDDVAIIVEDKAVAVSPAARTGQTQRVRQDLMRVLTKADGQAKRLRTAIRRDRGVRLDRAGWLDLSAIREVHTVAVSLDDLPGTSTTTADLVAAGLLDSDSMTWTVSLHDLDLITELIDHPAEFLLYLRRRRDPKATVMFLAPDELDLFLYFLDEGLYVEPDPEEVRRVFPHMPPATEAERQRFLQQGTALITSRTDALDLWHRSQSHEDQSGEGPAREGEVVAAKPAMTPSPLTGLVEALEQRRDFGWLSVAATLLSGATEFQVRVARFADYLLDNPNPGTNGRSLAVPLVTTVEDSWLLVWMTRPADHATAAHTHVVRTYLQAKKHQLGIPRSVAFVYEEQSRALESVIYDAYDGPLSDEVQHRLKELLPADTFNADLTIVDPPQSRAKPTRGKRVPARGNRKRRR
jgi:hypothetical protein